LFCAAGAAAVLTLSVTPAQAQQFTGFRNSRVGTNGDISSIKLRPQIRPLPGLNFSTLGLFGDAEVVGQFNFPQPFIFALPDFAGAGLDFTGVSFPDYLTLVANSYDLASSTDYLQRFQFQNIVTAQNPGFIPTFQQVIQAHQQDFLAGGGFLPLSGTPVTPTKPEDLPPTFTPIDPVFTTPLIPKTTGAGNPDTNTDTSSAGELAGVIGDATGLTLDNTTGLAIPAGASQAAAAAAASVSVVPEPAALGLLAMGSFALLGRVRRR